MHRSKREAALPATTQASARPLPSMPARRVSMLLDFDTPADFPFVSTDPPGGTRFDRAVVRGDSARPGAASLALSQTTRTVTLKLAPLLQGRPFPADWTLLGGYLRADGPVTVTIDCKVAGRSPLTRVVSIGATGGGWIPAMLDLSPLGGTTGLEAGELTFRFSPSAGGVWLDDVMLIDNHESVVDTAPVATTGPAADGSGEPQVHLPASDPGWSVRRRGLNYLIVVPGRFSLALPTAHAVQGGWSVAEASPIRVRFASSVPPGSLTIYPDGRTYWGDSLRLAAASLALSDDATALEAQHASPARVLIPESMGRPDRATPGDADNDGYNETRGAYPIVASGTRLEATVIPTRTPAGRVVLEIAQLPAGDLRVAMDGRAVDRAVRLKGGLVLIELPGRLDRPATVNVRVDRTSRGR